MPSSRQLAAIMFTDIVGYTALMGKDEQKAFEQLDKNRQIQKPIIEEFNGRFIKELGDGILASFTTVSDSVYAAIQILEACRTKENISLRIGIHHGEILSEKNDVFGDAVNIASRLQSIAPPGEIFISESVHQNIANKKGIETIFIKEETLKNVQAPVRIYQVITEGHEDLLKTLQHNKRKKPILRGNLNKIAMAAGVVLLLVVIYWLYTLFSGKNPLAGNVGVTSKNSIAVLPFTNISNDKNNEYFSDGITEDIITHLSKIKKLKVIARTSSMLYKGSKRSIKEIAEELKVATIVEGSVQKSGNQVRVTAQLIDAKTQEHIWADSWDRNIDQIFVIQSELAQQIASQLNLQVSADEKKNIEKKATLNIAAYEPYLKGKNSLYESPDKAVPYFLEALKIDSGFALAWAGISYAYSRIGLFNEPDRLNYYLDKALSAGIKGIIYGPELSETHMMLGEVMKGLTLNPLSSIDELRKSILINPNNAEAYSLLGFACSEAGLFKEAESSLIKARELDPLSELMKSAWFQYYQNSRNHKGVRNFRYEFNDHNSPPIESIYFHFLTDQHDSVLYYGSLYARPRWRAIAYARLGQTAHAQKIIDSLKNHLTKSDNVLAIATIYAWMNEKDKAIDWLERSFYLKSRSLLAIKVDKLYDPLRNEKRFIELLRKMGVE